MDIKCKWERLMIHKSDIKIILENLQSFNQLKQLEVYWKVNVQLDVHACTTYTDTRHSLIKLSKSSYGIIKDRTESLCVTSSLHHQFFICFFFYI